MAAGAISGAGRSLGQAEVSQGPSSHGVREHRELQIWKVDQTGFSKETELIETDGWWVDGGWVADAWMGG